MSAPDNTECDCGRPKFAGNEACTRCTFLDGGKAPGSRVIEVLRLVGWMTQRELEVEAGYRRGSLFRPLHVLLGQGRVVRQRRETDTVETSGRCQYGGRMRMSAGATDAWEYSLATKRREA